MESRSVEIVLGVHWVFDFGDSVWSPVGLCANFFCGVFFLMLSFRFCAFVLLCCHHSLRAIEREYSVWNFRQLGDFFPWFLIHPRFAYCL